MADNEKKNGGFWDLGQPREKKYAKPDFSGHTVAPVDISEDKTAEPASADVTQGEKIPPRGEMSANQAENKKTISGSFWLDPIGGGRINISSYRRHNTARKPMKKTDVPLPRERGGEIVATYTPNGTLIRKIDIRTWASDTEFYGRFTSDALISHRSMPSVSPDAPFPPVSYFSYVPQYAHMNREQNEYYLYVRENIRRGHLVECDLPYLQLYIFEIINLSDVIAPQEGAELLARIWLGYRRLYPRLDGYLCEWLPDYCMINGIDLPDTLVPILAEVTVKAQFKEVFIEKALMTESDILGSVIADAASDYDYKSSRYYRDNRELYDRLIPAVLTRVVKSEITENAGMFALDRTYRMTRDSYCGAIVSSAKKRRIDVEFCSFTRRADVRQAVTNLVKYAENNIRRIAGIKAKLSAELTDSEALRLTDAFFTPLLPQDTHAESEKYMPEDYLKNYEAEESGFDLGRAEEIEKKSWANTERLTGKDFSAKDSEEEDGTPAVDGEIGFDPANTTFVERNKDNGDTTLVEERSAGRHGNFTNVETEQPDDARRGVSTNVEKDISLGCDDCFTDVEKTENAAGFENSTNVKCCETTSVQEKRFTKVEQIASTGEPKKNFTNVENTIGMKSQSRYSTKVEYYAGADEENNSSTNVEKPKSDESQSAVSTNVKHNVSSKANTVEDNSSFTKVEVTIPNELNSDNSTIADHKQPADAGNEYSTKVEIITSRRLDSVSSLKAIQLSEESGVKANSTNVESSENNVHREIYCNSKDLSPTNVELIAGGFERNTTIVETITDSHDDTGDSEVKDALRAALDGRFGEYCRSIFAFEGQVADRVNTRMLEILGDVALEADGATYRIIDDYREEIEEWL